MQVALRLYRRATPLLQPTAACRQRRSLIRRPRRLPPAPDSDYDSPGLNARSRAIRHRHARVADSRSAPALTTSGIAPTLTL
jgi:hypothetical protein